MRLNSFVSRAKSVLIAAAVAMLPSAAQALTVQYSHSVNEAWEASGPGATTPISGARHTLPLFDPALGTLQSARVDYSYNIQSFASYNGRLPTGLNLGLDDDPFTPGDQHHVGISFFYTPTFSYLGQSETGTSAGPIAICVVSGPGDTCSAFGSTTEAFAGSVNVAAGDLASLIGVGTFEPEINHAIGPVVAIDLIPIFLPDGTLQGYANAIPGAGDGHPDLASTVIGGSDVGTVTVTYEYTASTAVPSPPAALPLLIGVAGIAAARRKRR